MNRNKDRKNLLQTGESRVKNSKRLLKLPIAERLLKDTNQNRSKNNGDNR